MSRVIPLNSSRIIIKFSLLTPCNRTELTWVENRVFINDDNLVSRHSQDNYNEKLTQQYFHIWDLDSCVVLKVIPLVVIWLSHSTKGSQSLSQNPGAREMRKVCLNVIFRKHFTIIICGAVPILKMMSCCCFPIFCQNFADGWKVLNTCCTTFHQN